LCTYGQVADPTVPQQVFPSRGAWQQVPPQVSVVQEAWQVPLTQLWSDPQTLPQLPQLTGSIRVSTHFPLQAVRPVGHESWQIPAEQV
jgi:hypothetical protein